MPSPLARLDGDSTRLAPGSERHQAPSTSSPNAVSAAPYGRGLTMGSLTATPCAMTIAALGCAGRADPHPTTVRTAATASPAATLRCLFMPIRRTVAWLGCSRCRTVIRPRGCQAPGITFCHGLEDRAGCDPGDRCGPGQGLLRGAGRVQRRP